MLAEIRENSVQSGIVPRVVHTSAPAFGSRETEVNLIDGIFTLLNIEINPQHLLDYVERVIGIYQADLVAALIRTCNPFFYLGLLFDVVSDLPAIAISKLGYNRRTFSISVFADW